MSGRRLERSLGALGVVAALGLGGSLFLYWYVAPYSMVSRIAGGGFELLFGVRDADAWTAVPGTSVALLVCALVIAGAMGWWVVAGSRALIPFALAAAVAAVAVAGFRLGNPPTHRVAVQHGIEGVYFTRPDRVAGGREVVVSQALSKRGGVDAAFGVALVALVASVAIALMPSRIAVPGGSGSIDPSRSARSSS